MPTYNSALSDYIVGNFAQEGAVLSRIHGQLGVHGLPPYTINPEEERFHQFLVCASGTRRVLELSALGSFSGIWIARGLPENGTLITIEKEQRHAALA